MHINRRGFISVMNITLDGEPQKTLCFCIPTYKNAEAIYTLTKQLLSSRDNRFEIVVVDDASGDNTTSVLQGIADDRLHCFANRENMGAKLNWFTSLEKGKAKWLYLVMGRDRLDASKIGRLINELDKLNYDDVGFALDRRNRKGDIVYYEGVEALIRFLGGDHPTGLILNRSLYSRILNRRDYFSNDKSGYPENYIKADLMIGHKSAILDSGVFIYDVNVNLAAKKSNFELNEINLHYSLPRRIILFNELIHMIEERDELLQTDKEREEFFFEKWKDLLELITYGWRDNNQDPESAMHYGQPVRYVSTMEMIRNVLTASVSIIIRNEGKLQLSLRRRLIALYKSAQYAVNLWCG